MDEVFCNIQNKTNLNLLKFEDFFCDDFTRERSLTTEREKTLIPGERPSSELSHRTHNFGGLHTTGTLLTNPSYSLVANNESTSKSISCPSIESVSATKCRSETNSEGTNKVQDLRNPIVSDVVHSNELCSFLSDKRLEENEKPLTGESKEQISKNTKSSVSPIAFNFDESARIRDAEQSTKGNFVQTSFENELMSEFGPEIITKNQGNSMIYIEQNWASFSESEDATGKPGKQIFDECSIKNETGNPPESVPLTSDFFDEFKRNIRHSDARSSSVLLSEDQGNTIKEEVQKKSLKEPSLASEVQENHARRTCSTLPDVNFRDNNLSKSEPQLSNYDGSDLAYPFGFENDLKQTKKVLLVSKSYQELCSLPKDENKNDQKIEILSELLNPQHLTPVKTNISINSSCEQVNFPPQTLPKFDLPLKSINSCQSEYIENLGVYITPTSPIERRKACIESEDYSPVQQVKTSKFGEVSTLSKDDMFIMSRSQDSSNKIFLSEPDLTAIERTQYFQSETRNSTKNFDETADDFTLFANNFNSEETNGGDLNISESTENSPLKSCKQSAKTWTPDDIEKYLMNINFEENMRLGFVTSEDIELYEWKRATGNKFQLGVNYCNDRIFIVASVFSLFFT